eukprot:1048766-Prymnesium_polylepis.1
MHTAHEAAPTGRAVTGGRVDRPAAKSRTTPRVCCGSRAVAVPRPTQRVRRPFVQAPTGRRAPTRRRARATSSSRARRPRLPCRRTCRPSSPRRTLRRSTSRPRRSP